MAAPQGWTLSAHELAIASYFFFEGFAGAIFACLAAFLVAIEFPPASSMPPGAVAIVISNFRPDIQRSSFSARLVSRALAPSLIYQLAAGDERSFRESAGARRQHASLPQFASRLRLVRRQTA